MGKLLEQAPNGMTINWSIDIGTIATIVLALFGGFGAIIAMKSDVNILSNKLVAFEASIETLTKSIVELITQSGRYDERIKTLERSFYSERMAERNRESGPG